MPGHRAVCSAAAVLAAALLWASESQAQPGPSYPGIVVYERPKLEVAQPAGRVAELIAALGSQSAEQRQEAARALLAMGTGIRPQLAWALEREEAAVPASDLRQPIPLGPGYVLPRYAHHELTVLISHVDEQLASAASVITLRYKDAPLTDVLRDLGRQANTQVHVPASYQPLDWVGAARVTVDVERPVSGRLSARFRRIPASAI